PDQYLRVSEKDTLTLWPFNSNNSISLAISQNLTVWSSEHEYTCVLFSENKVTCTGLQQHNSGENNNKMSNLRFMTAKSSQNCPAGEIEHLNERDFSTCNQQFPVAPKCSRVSNFFKT